jgi:hypothetical protein
MMAERVEGHKGGRAMEDGKAEGGEERGGGKRQKTQHQIRSNINMRTDQTRVDLFLADPG